MSKLIMFGASKHTVHVLFSKRQSFPIGGKLSLLNSVITSLAIFALCTLWLPAKIIELIDKIRRKCLWTKKTEQGDTCNSLAS